MILKQKNLSCECTFDFQKEKLRYSIKDRDGRSSFAVNYESISLDSYEYEERKAVYKNIGILWIILGVVFSIWSYAENSHVSVSFVLYAGIVCYMLYYFFRVEFIVFQSDFGLIHILKTKNHEQIVKEITKRRNDQILRLYGEVDLNNDITSEIEKYKIFLSEGIIDEDQYREFKKKIEKEMANKNISGFYSSLN
jgi:hypothetical protein